MSDYAFRIVNVFAQSRLGGNPLCVFEDARGLDDASMQALARQFNLSETTFILPGSRADARVRIFTPEFEMPFAGHPTLGTAEVVRSVLRTGDRITLEMMAGTIAVEAEGNLWTLDANPPKHRGVSPTREAVAAMLGLSASDLAGEPLWVDTGSEQLLIPLASDEAVARAAPVPNLMRAIAANSTGAMAYLFRRDDTRVVSRFFFLQRGAVLEDPGTGSACANLGGWLLATGAPLPQRLQIDQGAATGRACRLGLEVTVERRIRVSGHVVDLARGTLTL